MHTVGLQQAACIHPSRMLGCGSLSVLPQAPSHQTQAYKVRLHISATDSIY